MKQRFFFDMDGTLFKWRNIKLDIREEEDIRDIEKKVSEVLYQDGYFLSLPPYKNVIEAARLLMKRDDTDVYILSCVLADKNGVSPAAQKVSALLKHFPGIEFDHILLVPDGQDKRDYLPTEMRPDDVLIDDCTERNLNPWAEKGIAIKLLNGVNSTKGTWKGSTINYLDRPMKIANDIIRIAKNREVIRSRKPKWDKSFYDPELREDLSL